MKDIAFCSFAFGHGYFQTLQRLRESILAIDSKANLFFYSDSRRRQVGDASHGDEPGAAEHQKWDDTYAHTGLPKGARRFCESMYGFKPHLIQAARDAGFKKVIFLDPSIIVKKSFEYFNRFISQYGILALEDCGLNGAISNRCVEYFKANRSDLQDKKLVGGSFYYFDFNSELCCNIFSDWKKAEEDDIYGSQSEASSVGLQGHRSDEAVMSMCLYKYGSRPLAYQPEFSDIFVKKHHFKC